MTGSRLIELIEKIVKQNMPGELELATVKSVSPLSIRIDAMDANIPAAFLYITVSLNGQVQIGDRVAVMPIGKGQRYLLMDKVVSA